VYYIHLLPALPHVWKDGEINGLKTRGGLTVDMQWKDHQVYALHIKADADVTIYLHYNYKTDSIKRLKKGQEILFRAIDGPL
ncbi:MAG: glycoside hydrolase family 95-like protein, partial [Prevotella histicola]